MKPPSPKALEKIVALWNSKYPVGTRVAVRRSLGRSVSEVSETVDHVGGLGVVRSHSSHHAQRYLRLFRPYSLLANSMKTSPPKKHKHHVHACLDFPDKKSLWFRLQTDPIAAHAYEYLLKWLGLHQDTPENN